ncbi:MAG: energy-coupling factor ABC transporter permease [Wenzhouxiangellaceae bacterium]|nr:energy-coupling factor ABC transporter permease [Wenzhouxiangellaceae bacterium]
MHIPDGLIAPEAYLAASALAVPAFAFGVRRVARTLDERTIPRLAVLTALAFVLSTVMIPLPGGTSTHLIGHGLLVLAFGFWPAFVAFSLVLLMQATVLGAGGITTLPVNAIAIGLVGGAVVAGGHRLLKTRFPAAAVVVPVWLGVVAAAFTIALVLGAQPWLGRDAGGQPLFFPFGPAVTLPVIVGPHVIIGLVEGLLAWLVLPVLQPRQVPA